MKVIELLNLLGNCNPEAKVEVMYAGSTWIFNGEYSEEVDRTEWGTAEGVKQVEETKVRIYCQEEDLELS